MGTRAHQIRTAAIAATASGAALAALVGVAGLVSTNAGYSYGYGYGCAPNGTYTYGYGYGYGPSASASASGSTKASSSASPSATKTSASPSSTATTPAGIIPTGLPTGIIPTGLPTGIVPTGILKADAQEVAAAATTSASPSPSSTVCPSSSATSSTTSTTSSKPTSSSTATGTTSGSPTPGATTSAPGSTAVPTFPVNPTPTPAGPLKVTLKISKVFVTLGTHVTLSGTVTSNGVAVAGVPVVLTETYSDGKHVPLGSFTTAANGTYSHIDRPLYIGNITAAVSGTKSNTVPSRVILTYRKVTTSTSGGLLTLNTSTRPGFFTGTNRQERVQLLLTDSHGRQKKVLGLVNAGKRQNAPAEAQGINPITFKNINLGHGTFYVVVKVLGTPVNTGAPSKPIKVRL